jgi:hypothetical protein
MFSPDTSKPKRIAYHDLQHLCACAFSTPVSKRGGGATAHLQYQSRNSNPLLLPTGQLHTPFANLIKQYHDTQLQGTAPEESRNNKNELRGKQAASAALTSVLYPSGKCSMKELAFAMSAARRTSSSVAVGFAYLPANSK